VLLGAFLQGAFFVMSISAYYLLRGRHRDFAQSSFRVALIFGAMSSLAIGISGHEQGRALAHNQPATLAAMEGHFKSGPATLYLFGAVDAANEKVGLGVGIPGGLSFLVHDDFGKSLPGLDHFDRNDRPSDELLPIIFSSYHLMVGVGSMLILLSILGMFFLWRGTLFQKRWLLGLFVLAVLGPFLANQGGWVAAEVGRQPFIVYPEVDWQGDAAPIMKTHGDRPGLRTQEGLSSTKVVGPTQVVQSIVMFSLVYLLLFVVWVYVLNSKVQHGPDEAEAHPATTSAENLLAAAAANKPAGGDSLTATAKSIG
jgi:cytochrome d ubiquinol oxidase subunit I